MRKGTLFILTGPSGAGKGTLLRQAQERDDNLFVSVSATTRAPRSDEIYGMEYYFLSEAEFLQKVDENAFLEYASYVGNYYGTLEAPVQRKLDEGVDVFLEIEVQGAMAVHEKCPDAVMIFVSPPSYSVLKERLLSRGTESEDTIEKRMETACREIACAPQFEYIIVNDQLEQARQALTAIIRAERCKTSRLEGCFPLIDSGEES